MQEISSGLLWAEACLPWCEPQKAQAKPTQFCRSQGVLHRLVSPWNRTVTQEALVPQGLYSDALTVVDLFDILCLMLYVQMKIMLFSEGSLYQARLILCSSGCSLLLLCISCALGHWVWDPWL